MFTRKHPDRGMFMMAFLSVALTVPVIYYMKRIDETLRELSSNDPDMTEDTDY